MAIPDTFRFVFVALAAMVAYRVMNEFAGKGTASNEGHAVGNKTNATTAPPIRRHKLRKNQVLIEYCTS